MKAATVHELKEELKHQSAAQLLELCSRLARFKKENKELLTYLLFEAQDEQAYIKSVKDYIDIQFEEIPEGNSLYLVKKSLRKILRHVNKYIRYTGSKTVEIQLLLYYCGKLKESEIPIRKSTALTNIYQTQLKKIGKVLPTLHEDLQYDYQQKLELLSTPL
ncbi:MAG: hypothetical protein V4615_14270 [Bacteroidota bacterium]